MGTLIPLPHIPAEPALAFYRATELARLPGICDAMADRSAYLHDVLQLCLRGAWDRELGQFMPPQSLRSSLQALLALGLIERVEDPPPVPAALQDRPRRLFLPANQSPFSRRLPLAA